MKAIGRLHCTMYIMMYCTVKPAKYNHIVVVILYCSQSCKLSEEMLEDHCSKYDVIKKLTYLLSNSLVIRQFIVKVH